MSSAPSWRSCSARSGIEDHLDHRCSLKPHEEHGRRIVGARYVGAQPYFSQLAPELHFPRHLVGKPDRSTVALVLPVEPHVLVETPADLQRAQQPPAKRVVDFDADVSPEQTRDARYRGFVRGRGRREPHASEAGRGPDQRRIEDEPAQIGQLRILVGAGEIAHRNFAGELAGDLESRADFRRSTVPLRETSSRLKRWSIAAVPPSWV